MSNSNYKIEIYTSQNYRNLAVNWNQLFSNCEMAFPYMSFAWIESFIEQGHFRGEICILTTWTADKLVGVWPLVIRHRWGLRIAEVIGDEVPSYLGILTDPDHLSFLPGIVSYCINKRIFDLYFSINLSRDDVGTQMLMGTFQKEGSTVCRNKRNCCCCIDLPDSFEKYLETTKSIKRRKQLRYEEKKLYSNISTEIQHYQGSNINDIVLNRIVKIQNESWLSQRGAADLSNPFRKHLVRKMSEAGLCDLWIMVLNGEDAAFVLALTSKRRFHYFRTAFDLKHESQLSIGKILTLHVIREACTGDFKIFDFGHGDAEYKRFWATGYHEVQRIAIGCGMRGRIFAHVACFVWRLAEVQFLRLLYRRVRKWIHSGQSD